MPASFLDFRLLLLLGVTLPMGFVTLLLTARAWQNQRRLNAARGWQSAPGRVIAARVEPVHVRVRVSTSSGRYRLAMRYAPVVVYEYSVGGRRYQGERLRLGPRLLSSEAADAGREIAPHPPGSLVTVWYDPQNPADCALERTSGAIWVEWLVSGLMLALTLLAALVISW